MSKFRTYIKNNPHWFWTLCLPLILAMYIIPEKIVTDDYYALELAIDRAIPFVGQFIVPYLLWFPMLAAVGLWLLFRDGDGFRRYMLFLTLAYAVGAAVFLLFPNGQDLRPEAFDRENVFTYITGIVYSVDTNTNVFPSMHVAGCFAVVFAVFNTPTVKSPAVRTVTAVAAALITVSTLFVKQHTVLDIAASVVLSLPLYLLIYRLPKPKDKKH